MRRPTPTEARRRRTLAAAALVAALALIGATSWLLRDGGDGDEDRAAQQDEKSSTQGVAAAESPPDDGSPTTDPVGTAAEDAYTSTGRFQPMTGPDGPIMGEATTAHSYRVEVEEGTGVAIEDFGPEVERILSDPRGWTVQDGVGLQRVTGAGADFVVTLATPDTVDLLCAPLNTEGRVSCAQEGHAIINVLRWDEGSAKSGLSLGDYRDYVISHEVGHVLGHSHVECPGPGVPAPVMMQQTHGIGECSPNPWPAPDRVPRTDVPEPEERAGG